MSNFIIFNSITGEYTSGSAPDADIALQVKGENEHLIVVDEPFNAITHAFDYETGQVVPREKVVSPQDEAITVRARLSKSRLLSGALGLKSAEYFPDRQLFCEVAIVGGVIPVKTSNGWENLYHTPDQGKQVLADYVARRDANL